jgi:predicted  nucleic acid-binding Zn-ribbon protein
MAEKTFDGLTMDGKFKAMRDDIRAVAKHSQDNRNELKSIVDTLHELQNQIRQLQDRIVALEAKDH